MAFTETSSAYAAEIKYVHEGIFPHLMIHTVSNTASASANALVVLGPRVQNQLYIMGLEGQHTSGADSCPCDIGYDTTISAFATQKTQGTNFVASDAVGGVFPFKVSVSDDAAALYRVVKFGLTPGTNTTGIILKYAVLLAADPN